MKINNKIILALVMWLALLPVAVFTPGVAENADPLPDMAAQDSQVGIDVVEDEAPIEAIECEDIDAEEPGDDALGEESGAEAICSDEVVAEKVQDITSLLSGIPGEIVVMMSDGEFELIEFIEPAQPEAADAGAETETSDDAETTDDAEAIIEPAGEEAADGQAPEETAQDGLEESEGADDSEAGEAAEQTEDGAVAGDVTEDSESDMAEAGEEEAPEDSESADGSEPEADGEDTDPCFEGREAETEPQQNEDDPVETDAEPQAADPGMPGAVVHIGASWEGDLMLGSRVTLTMTVEGADGEYRTFWEVNRGDGVWTRLEDVEGNHYTFTLDTETANWNWRGGVEASPVPTNDSDSSI